jgi:EAL domain-containing protein (putative c-di-GMP-specific phosphodiesterase class I)
MSLSDTRVWRKERGLRQKPEGILFYSPNPIVLAKLKGVLHFHGLVYLEPLPNTFFVAAETSVLGRVVEQLRDSLSASQYEEVRRVLSESRTPSAEELAYAPMYFEKLDNVLALVHSRWLVKQLATDALSIAFQPLVAVDTQTCVACECLVRGDQGGIPVGAESLLSSARILGVSHELDHSAWRSALKQGQTLVQSGLDLFLNFTPSSVYDPQFNIQKTKHLCHEMGVDISHLVFEVTEAEKVRDLDVLRAVMQEYRAEGARIALDDLGSGYSSILHLADLRPDYVKLDQRLVHGAWQDELRLVLLKAITKAAHELNIRVVAEGVETEDDLRFSVEIGADFVQGYFLARPAQSAPPISTDAIRILEQLCHQAASR